MRTTGEVVEEALSFSAEAALAEVAEALAEVASEEVWAVAEEPARGSDPLILPKRKKHWLSA